MRNTYTYPQYDSSDKGGGLFSHKVYPWWSWTILWFILSVISIGYWLQSSGFGWLLFFITTIFSIANFLFFLTHKLAHLPDKRFYTLQNELSGFARFIGDGPNIIRRTQYVDVDKPVVYSQVFDANLRKITTVYDSMGFNADAPLLIWYYIDYSRMSFKEQRKILMSTHDSNMLNSICSAYVHRMVQSVIFTLQQDKLSGPEAAFAMDAFFKEIFYQERDWNPLTWIDDLRSEKRNPWGLVLVEFTGTPAQGKVLQVDRNKALASTYRAIETLRVSDEKKIPLEAMMQANAASSPYARSSYRMYGRANMPSITREDAQKAAQENRDVDEATFVSREEVGNTIPDEAQPMVNAAARPTPRVRLRDNRNIQLMQTGIAQLLSFVAIALSTLGILSLKVVREGLAALISWLRSALKNIGAAVPQQNEQVNTATEEQQIPDNIIFVTVEVGDSYNDLAQKYGTTPEEIIRLNNLDTTKPLIIGQLLRIPDNKLARSKSRLSAESFTRPSASTFLRSKTNKIASADDENLDDEQSSSKPKSATDFLKKK